MSEEIKLVNISLEEMFDRLIHCIVHKKEFPIFYYKREWEVGKFDYNEITEVDLMQSRFKTKDDDFSEYEWELENSNIFVKLEE